MRIYLHQLGVNAQSHYRQVLPARHCAGDGLELVVSQKLDGLDYDAFMWPRMINPKFAPTIEALKKKGKMIIWELDDDIWNIPAWNPASTVYDKAHVLLCNWMAEQADVIIVSTDPLAEVVKENTGKEAVALPNLIDLDEWPQLPPREAGPIKILWAGSQHHDEDLNLLVEPLNQIIDEYGDKVQVLFFGDWPREMATTEKIMFSHLSRQLPKRKNVGFVAPVPLHDYPRTLAAIRPDIGLAPLTDCKFNKSKSNLKLLEYSMAGAATIASDMPPYEDARFKIEDGNTSRLCTLDGDLWFTAIKWLLDDEQDRRQLAEERRDWVVQNNSWQHSPQKQTWVDLFRRLA